LNSFVLDAIGEGLLRRNPYKQVRIDKAKHGGGDKYLTPKEFKLIERVKLPTESLRRVRDLFVFQTYTCLSYTDLAEFDIEQVRKVSGRKVYAGHRAKTGQEYVFVLLEPALRVLERYGGVLPLISNVKYNQYLKALAQHAGIDKPLSSHWARHTGATLLLNKGVNMEVVAKVLGHSSTKITREVYAKLLDETVVKAMARL
jgi:integrase